MAKVMHPHLDVGQDLRERRTVFLGCTDMLWRVGKACEDRGMKDEARQSYAAMCILIDQVGQIDQALGVFTDGAIRQSELEMACGDCGKKSGYTAKLNVLLQDGESPSWETLYCHSCGVELGRYRNDSPEVPQGYALSIYGVMNYEKDGRELSEKTKDANFIPAGESPNMDDLPSVEELRTRALVESGDPVAVETGKASTGDGRLTDIRKMLDQAKAKLAGETEEGGDDF